MSVPRDTVLSAYYNTACACKCYQYKLKIEKQHRYRKQLWITCPQYYYEVSYLQETLFPQCTQTQLQMPDNQQEFWGPQGKSKLKRNLREENANSFAELYEKLSYA